MLSVREMQITDIPDFLAYWYDSDPAYMHTMGVDIKKMPPREQLHQMLLEQLSTPIENRRSYCIVWENNGRAIGHSNTNPTIYGEEAKMHLHLWSSTERKKGMGTELVKMTLPYYFKNLQLKTVWCEPYALNAAPNKTLEKVGFTLVKEYFGVPSFISFEQPVKQWRMLHADFELMAKNANEASAY